MVKTLVVYYSLTGNTKLIAETIAKTINADILELKPVKELNPESGTRFMWGGAQAVMKKKPKLEEFELNPLDYDLIFIGSPVWAWRYTPPIRSFLSQIDLKGKKILLFMCCAGNGQKAMERFIKALNDLEVIDNIRFQEPLKKNPEEAKKRAADWAKEVVER
jgi:flavodoxin